jgi:hypothetical protein
MHLFMYQESKIGMDLMKFANNHCEKFSGWGSGVVFILGLAQFLIGIMCEFINLIIIKNQKEVFESIYYFLALSTVVMLPRFYSNA